MLDDFELNHEDPDTSSSGLSVVYSSVLDPLEDEMQDTDCHFDWLRLLTSPLDPFPVCESGMRCFGGDPESTDCTACANGAVPDTESSAPCDFKPDVCPPFAATQPMNGFTRSRDGSESRGVVVTWGPANPSTFYKWKVPPLSWEREDLFLSFRVAQAPRHPETLALNGEVDYTVTVRDGSSRESSLRLGAYGAGITKPFPRRGPGLETWDMPVQNVTDCFCRQPSQGALQFCCKSTDPGAGGKCNPHLSDDGWQAEFETVRIRMTDFLNNGSDVDLGDLEEIRFEFGSNHGSARGRIAIDDVEVTSDTMVLDIPPCPSVTPCNGVSCVQDAAISSEDSGVSQCMPASGPALACSGGQTVHVVTYSCEDAPCCFESPACLCFLGGCPTGEYLECQ